MFKQFFPIYNHHPQLVYLDSAASTLKNSVVLDREHVFATTRYANVHRSVYSLSAYATEDYEGARAVCANYFHVASEGFIFVRCATVGINVFAQTVIAPRLRATHNIVITVMEHHANLVIWHTLCSQVQAELRVARIMADGTLDQEHLASLIDDNTLLVAMTHVSNVTGVINNLDSIKNISARGIWTLVDGAQMLAHHRVDVGSLGCDAYVVSAHKAYGPSGIGAVMLSERARSSASVYHMGGGVVARVQHDGITYQDYPWRFEAGTPHITGAVGFSAALEWLSVHAEAIVQHEQHIWHYLWQQWHEHLGDIPMLGHYEGQGMCAFNMPHIHAHDVATWCDSHHVAIRAGALCAAPFVEALGHKSLARVSLGCYNDVEDINIFIDCMKKLYTRVLHAS